jgi:Xaa-Pro dipeptidase
VKKSLTDAEQALVQAQESWERNKEKNPVAVLVRLLKDRGIAKGKIGLDESNLSAKDPAWVEDMKQLPNLETIPAQKILREIRAAKSEDEIRRIEEALRITEKAWEIALEQTREGMTERRFGEIFEHAIISNGGRIVSPMGMYGPPIGFGRCSAFVDIAMPSDYKLRRGDLIRFDGGCSYLGYPCDMARSAVLGQPSEKLREYYKAILEGEQHAIEMAQPGIEASAIFSDAVAKVKERIPHYRRHHTGHGWGIEGYDPPLIAPNDHTILEEGMVLCFETPYYEVGWGGPMVEDVVVVTKKSPRLLTRSSAELRTVEG